MSGSKSGIVAWAEGYSMTIEQSASTVVRNSVIPSYPVSCRLVSYPIILFAAFSQHLGILFCHEWGVLVIDVFVAEQVVFDGDMLVLKDDDRLRNPLAPKETVLFPMATDDEIP